MKKITDNIIKDIDIDSSVNLFKEIKNKNENETTIKKILNTIERILVEIVSKTIAETLKN